LELFAGAGGLTAAVARKGLKVFAACDIRPGRQGLGVRGDLLDHAVFKSYVSLARSGRLRWLHGGPPCTTFSRARRSDIHGTVRKLRSEQFPLGLPHVVDRRVAEGNLLAKRLCQLARIIQRLGGFWSIENPEHSLIWRLPCMISLFDLKGVRLIVGDQCCHGCLYKKPTGWLTNAAFLEVFRRRCPGPPTHLPHPPLEGRAVTPDGRDCWLTELAAEYPEDLCDAAASAYAKVAQEPMVPARAISLRTGTRFFDPLTSSVREAREAANKERIGGLRDPSKSLRKLPQWYDIGTKVATALDDVLMSRATEVTNMLSLIGRPDAVDPPASLVQAARSAVAKVLSIEVYTGDGVWSEALSSLVREAADPEVAVPRWLSEATPLGITEEIDSCGIFPTLSTAEAAAAARNYAPRPSCHGTSAITPPTMSTRSSPTLSCGARSRRGSSRSSIVRKPWKRW